jgi:riboflavin synthase
MFTGIIEAAAEVVSVERTGTNTLFRFKSSISHELKIDQSVSHNGVCLTVVEVGQGQHAVVAIQETLSRTNLGALKVGDRVNLERCMLNNGRFDGHIVQGHVDQTAIVQSIQDMNGSWLFDFSYDAAQQNITVEKGSICVNGISLTCFNSKAGAFTVAIIPYTFEYTNFHQLKVGDTVNLEFDIIGKYVQKLMGLKA